MKELNKLTIVTITYNNVDDLKNTTDSIKPLILVGAKHIIINGGNPIDGEAYPDSDLIEGKDCGIYDALNKGIERVQTPFFCLFHSGDLFTSNPDVMMNEIITMIDLDLDIRLNSCSLNFGNQSRIYNVSRWAPWMFKFGVQPPHPPIIYRHDFVNDLEYGINSGYIADFEYLEKIFKMKPNYGRGKVNMISMRPGGVTSSGIKSYFTVSREFIKLKGRCKGYLYMISRPFLKIILAL